MANTSGEPAVVLVVDDDEDTVSTLLELLAHAGFDAVGATSSAEAIDKVHRFRPKAVIVDCILRGPEDGCNVIRAIRADPHTAGAFIFAMSGAIEKDLAAAAAGADCFALKPVPPDVMLRLLREQVIRRT